MNRGSDFDRILRETYGPAIEREIARTSPLFAEFGYKPRSLSKLGRLRRWPKKQINRLMFKLGYTPNDECGGGY
jgi:hypothetical protein